MTPTSQPRPRTLFQPSRCAAPLRGRLPQSTGPGLGASSGHTSEHGSHLNFPEAHLPAEPQRETPGSLRLTLANSNQKPFNNPRTNRLEFDKAYALRCKSEGYRIPPKTHSGNCLNNPTPSGSHGRDQIDSAGR